VEIGNLTATLATLTPNGFLLDSWRVRITEVLWEERGKISDSQHLHDNFLLVPKGKVDSRSMRIARQRFPGMDQRGHP